MGVNFNYDTANNVETPTLVLTYKSGDRINNISGAVNFQYTESMKNPTEFSFEVHKKICNVWHQLETFRNVWVKEWNDWYTLVVEKNISNTSVKDVNAYHLPEYELANTKVTSEINTESDSTLADDETISTIYNPDNPKKSILDRILEPIRGFEIGYVSPSLKDLAYDFSFNNISIYDAFMEIAEQANAHFEFLAFTDEVTGKIRRVINFYDLEPYCSVCHTRLTSEETQCTNPDCLSTEIESGYGEDTSVFLSLDNILDSVTYTTNADAVKNCFKLEAGDEYMTSSILACNPNGSQYIWYMDTFIEEMSDLLRGTYENYIADYNKYNNTEVYTLDIAEYNELINKYINLIPANAKIPDELILLESSCTGYPALINVLYDVMDAEMYLDTTLMSSTSISLEPTTAMEQAENLIKNISSVAINGDFSAVTVKNAVLDMVKALIDSRYSVKITVSEPIKMESSTDKTVIGAWRGTFYIENYSNEEEFAEISTDRISELTSEDRDYITITNEYESYLTEKLNKILEKGENKNYGISSLFDLEKSIETFISELKYYGLSTLEIFQKCCDDVIAVLIDQGIGVTTHYLYNSIYVPYDQRAKAIVTEIITREQEITVIQNLEEQINDIIANVQEKLDLQSTLEKADCWTEFCLLRREDTYSNSTYISDGLSNAKLFKKANQFMDTAKKELVKSATLQHSISATLKNIFTIKEFEPFWKKFKVGNWIRVEVDEEVFKLRLIEYTFDFSDFQGMDITFSDVIRVGNVVDDTKDLISEMRSISGNYSYVERQAAQGKSSYETISKWFETGMDATMTKIVNSADNVSMIFDSAGLLGRRYIDFSDSEFEDEQMRLINNSLVFTRDNWKSVCTAVGKFYYVSGKDANGNDIVVPVYGINGEVIAGKLFIGQNLILQNISGSFTFDENGFIVKTYDEETGIVGTDRFRIDPNGDIYITPTSLAITSDSTVTIDSTNFKLEADGTATMKNAVIEGTLNGASGSFSGTITAGPDSKIGPWNISSTSIWKDSQTHGSSGGMYFGDDGLSVGNTFIIYSDGSAEATNLHVTGNSTFDGDLTGATGTFTGCLKVTDEAGHSLEIDPAGNIVLIDKAKTDGTGSIFSIIKNDYEVMLSPYSILASNSTLNKRTSISPEGISLLDYSGNTLLDIGSDYIMFPNDYSRIDFTNGTNASSNCYIYGAITAEGTEICVCANRTSLSGNGCNITLGEGFTAGNTAFVPGALSDAGELIAEDNAIYLGASKSRWKAVYAIDGSINTSDERDKIILGRIPQKYLDLYMDLNPILYHWKDFDTEKIHMGLGAQSVESSALNRGITLDELAAIDYDKWDKPDENGRFDRYGLNYAELSVLTIPIVQDHEREIRELKANYEERINKLESLINQLLTG